MDSMTVCTHVDLIDHESLDRKQTVKVEVAFT